MAGENLQAVFAPVIRVALYVGAAVLIAGLFACVAWG